MTDVLALQAAEDPAEEQNGDLPGWCSQHSVLCSLVDSQACTDW